MSCFLITSDMSTIPAVIVEKAVTGEPSKEQSVTAKSAYTKLFNITVKKRENEVTFTHQMKDMVSEGLKGLARVDLYELAISYVLTEEGQHIKCGLGPVGGTLDIDQVSMMEGGFQAYASGLNLGRKITEILKVPDIMSKQIQPPSSAAPTMQLYFSASGGVNVQFHIKINHDGPEIRHSVVDFQ